MYHFIAHFTDMTTNAINDDPVSVGIEVDSYPYDNMTECDAWKVAIDRAFDYCKQHDNLSFDTIQLLSIS